MSCVIQYLTTIHFGAGARAQLPALLDEFSVRRPLLVTDRGVYDAGIVARVPVSSSNLFAEVPANPDEKSVLRGLACYQAGNCDGIVAVGGGSPLDCAKGIALLVTHPQPLDQYAVIRGGQAKITQSQGRMPPVIAIPTTAGTGSEVGRAALITFGGGQKLALISSLLIPTAAICDPELTLDLPPQLTAATGMDAISHCVETYCSPRENPVADAIALDGLSRAHGALLRAVRDGHDLHARQEMMMAALEGGLTFQKGLGMVHSLSHPLGALPNRRLHHGTLNAILLPHVLRFNRPVCVEKMERMAAAIGIGSADGLPEYFETLCEDVGLPTRLSELGVTRTDIDGVVAAALQDHSTPTNPRAISAADCHELLRSLV